MRVLFSSTWGHGHVFPMVPLSRACVAAGHEVLWAAPEPGSRLVAAAGLPTVIAGLDTAGVAAVEARLGSALSDLPLPERAAFAFSTMFGAWAAPVMASDLLAVAHTWGPDLLVHEQAELASPLVASVLGLPLVTHSFGGAVPAPILSRAGAAVAGLWAEHGKTVPERAGCHVDGYLDICPPSVQGVDLGHLPHRTPLRPGGYTGAATDPADPLPAAEVGQDPLVLLTLGTVRALPGTMAAALAGLAELPVRVLATVGPHGDPVALGSQPPQVRVVRWVDQSAVLPHCSVVVSHGGSGTFLGALADGLPQVCLPQAADQFRNATALTASGAGVALLPGSVTPAAVRDAVAEVLGSPSYAAAAARVAAEIGAMPTATDLVGTDDDLLRRLRGS